MSEEQMNLVSILDSVHNKLRLKKRQAKDSAEWKKLWEEHTTDLKTLQEYSSAMHQLATKIWDPRNALASDPDKEKGKDLVLGNVDKPEKLKCRIEWVVNHCKEYFDMGVGGEGDLSKKSTPVESKLRLLDVGSCYNPFSKYRHYFDMTALDLCPAPGFEGEVYQCDFLGLKVGDTERFLDKEKDDKLVGFTSLTELSRNSFDVIVFSYFLEYLADPEERVECCRKAFELLKPDGLLFVLRPDSNRVTPGGNSVLVKRMKIGMVLLGFKRIYFEKLEHLWCMAFKKLDEEEKKVCMEGPYFKKDVRKAEIEHLLENPDPSGIHELFRISQDFKEMSGEGKDEHEHREQSSGIEIESDQFRKELLDELGGYDVDSDSEYDEV